MALRDARTMALQLTREMKFNGQSVGEKLMRDVFGMQDVNLRINFSLLTRFCERGKDEWKAKL